MTSIEDQLGSTTDRIARIFRETLDRETPDPDLDLIDSGLLDSLAIVSLIAALEQEFEITVPLAKLDLASLRTIEAIGHLVSGGIPIGEGAESGLITLRDGDGTDPVFLFPGVAGEALGMLALTRRLLTSRHVYGVEAWGLPAARGQRLSIEARAAAALAAIHSAQPRGPYSLIGFSFGGVVAYEVARMLRAGDEPVALLTLIDSGADVAALSPAARMRHRITTPWRYVRVIASDLSHWIPHYRRRLALRRLPSPVDPRGGLSDRSVVETAQESARGEEAIAAYRPQRYGGDLVLFASPEQNPATLPPRKLWSDRVRGRVRIIDLPSSHGDILSGMSADQLAAGVDALLQR